MRKRAAVVHVEHKRTLRAILFACKQRQERRGDWKSLCAAAVFRSLLTTVCALVKMALCRTWIICASKSISDHMRPQISPRRRPVWRAIRQKRYALVPNTAFRSCLDCSTVRAAFSFVAMPPERRRSGTGDFAIRLLSTAALKIPRRIWIALSLRLLLWPLRLPRIN